MCHLSLYLFVCLFVIFYLPGELEFKSAKATNIYNTTDQYKQSSVESYRNANVQQSKTFFFFKKKKKKNAQPQEPLSILYATKHHHNIQEE